MWLRYVCKGVDTPPNNQLPPKLITSWSKNGGFLQADWLLKRGGSCIEHAQFLLWYHRSDSTLLGEKWARNGKRPGCHQQRFWKERQRSERSHIRNFISKCWEEMLMKHYLNISIHSYSSGWPLPKAGQSTSCFAGWIQNLRLSPLPCIKKGVDSVKVCSYLLNERAPC